MKDILCPISAERINEQVTRLNAFFAVTTIALAFLLNSAFFLIFLAADFYIRAFTNFKYSPISYLSSKLSTSLNLSYKPIDKAPKIFAARLGFFMSSVIAIAFIMNATIASAVIAGILAFFATLEFAFAICVGCTIYSYLVLPFYRN